MHLLRTTCLASMKPEKRIEDPKFSSVCSDIYLISIERFFNVCIDTVLDITIKPCWHVNSHQCSLEEHSRTHYSCTAVELPPGNEAVENAFRKVVSSHQTLSHNTICVPALLFHKSLASICLFDYQRKASNLKIYFCDFSFPGYQPTDL